MTMMKRIVNLALIIFSMAVLIVGLAGCGEAASGPQSAGSGKPSKAEWRKKLENKFGQTAAMGIIDNIKPDQFKSAMGSPDRTQTIGDDAYWYYECADGTIQLEL